MNDKMCFPEKWEDFVEDHSFKDAKEIYTNGSELIQVFRVKQMMEHYMQVERVAVKTCMNMLFNIPKKQEWIPCNERLPDESGFYLLTYKRRNSIRVIEMGLLQVNDTRIAMYDFDGDRIASFYADNIHTEQIELECFEAKSLAWMSLPEPYKESEE